MQESKICNKCKLEKVIEEFHKDAKTRTGTHSFCRSCVKKERDKFKEKNLEATRKWRKANPEKYKLAKRRWEKANPEKHKAYIEGYKPTMHQKQSEWYERNKELHSKRTTLRKKERQKEDPVYRLFMAAKDHLRHFQKRIFGKKIIRSKEAFGTTPDLLFQYIVSKFTEGMTFDNYGLWHLDHFKPIAAFPFDTCKTLDELQEMLKEAYHYTNLQPLWAKDNIQKGSLFEGCRYKLKLPSLLQEGSF
jgi:hypothetical protein